MKGWLLPLFNSFHNSLFAFALLIGITFVFLLEHPNGSAVKPHAEGGAGGGGTAGGIEGRSEDEIALQFVVAIYAAKRTVSITLALILMNQTLVALLNRSVDPPGALKINNRYLRLLPRMLLIPVVCLPIDRHMTSLTFLGIVSGLLLICLPWEWWASLQRDRRILER